MAEVTASLSADKPGYPAMLANSLISWTLETNRTREGASHPLEDATGEGGGGATPDDRPPVVPTVLPRSTVCLAALIPSSIRKHFVDCWMVFEIFRLFGGRTQISSWRRIVWGIFS